MAGEGSHNPRAAGERQVRAWDGQGSCISGGVMLCHAAWSSPFPQQRTHLRGGTWLRLRPAGSNTSRQLLWVSFLSLSHWDEYFHSLPLRTVFCWRTDSSTADDHPQVGVWFPSNNLVFPKNLCRDTNSPSLEAIILYAYVAGHEIMLLLLLACDQGNYLLQGKFFSNPTNKAGKLLSCRRRHSHQK